MAYVALWFPPVGSFGIVLAVAGFIVSIIEFKGLLRVLLCTCCLLLGIGEIVSIVKADNAHNAEVGQQHADIENLRGDLRKSETEHQVAEAYLKAKLEDSYQMNTQLAQLGPALMKLAQVSAEFEKKQYESKTASNKELYDFTMGVVKKIRDFSEKYKTLESQETDALMASAKGAQSDAERQRRWSEGTQKEIQLYTTESRNFVLQYGQTLYMQETRCKKGDYQNPIYLRWKNLILILF